MNFSVEVVLTFVAMNVTACSASSIQFGSVWIFEVLAIEVLQVVGAGF